MKTFLTLLKTEYIKRKKSYWLPIWIVIGIVSLLLLILLVAWMSKSQNININMNDILYESGNYGVGMRFVVYGFTAGVAWIFTFFMLMFAQSSLSQERQLGCELFYRCQPVNIWYNTGSKYIMHVLANSAGLLALGIVSALVVSISGIFSIGGFYFGNAIYGAVLGTISYLKVCLVFGSLFFLFSAIFNGNSFLKGLGIMGIIEGLLAIIEVMFKNTIELPSIFGSLFGLVGGMDMEFENTVTLGAVIGDARIFAVLVFAGVCFVSGTLIYKYKPIES